MLISIFLKSLLSRAVKYFNRISLKILIIINYIYNKST